MQIGEMVGLALSWIAEKLGVTHASLAVKAVTFSSNHRVENDTKGLFAAPEWLRGRLKQFPICYTRGKKISLTARFSVMMQPSSSETVEVKGTLKVGAATLEWTGKVTVKPTDIEVTTPKMDSSAALPNHVAFYDPARIEWEMKPPGKPWSSAGSSANLLYVVLADPAGTPPYWTLLDISCRGANGATTEQQLVEQAYSAFPRRRLRRKRDSAGLTYWLPGDTKATNTQQLLARADGGGQCGSWSEFLIDMYKVHGVKSADKILVVFTVPLWQAGSAGFLVKNWSFVGPGSNPPEYTHDMGTECVEQDGIPGQRNPNPPPAFFNHFIVRCFGKFYDPSYGGGPVADQLTWENGAIDGLFGSGVCGYPKSDNLARKLLEFHDLTTGTKI